MGDFLSSKSLRININFIILYPLSRIQSYAILSFVLNFTKEKLLCTILGMNYSGFFQLLICRMVCWCNYECLPPQKICQHRIFKLAALSDLRNYRNCLWHSSHLDYSKIPFNLGGRINLLFCFFWGIAAVVWLKILYPKFSGWIEKIPVKVGKIITPIAVILMIINILISGTALARYSDRITHKEPRNPVEQFLDQHFNDERIEHIYPNAKIVK